MIDVSATMYDRNMGLTVLILSTTLFDLSVSHNLFSKAEMRQFVAAGTEGLILEKINKSPCGIPFGIPLIL